jgi:hypothetical protein
VRLQSAGPTVRVVLLAESGEMLRAEISQERYRALGLCEGRTVGVAPRQITVFADPAAQEAMR